MDMARTKGSKNKPKPKIRHKTSTLSPKERIELISNLIIDRIIDDQNNGKQLLRKIQEVQA